MMPCVASRRTKRRILDELLLVVVIEAVRSGIMSDKNHENEAAGTTNGENDAF